MMLANRGKCLCVCRGEGGVIDSSLVNTREGGGGGGGLTRKEALAAVTVPCGLTKAGLSFAICSGVDTLMPLSLLTVVTFLPPAQRVNSIRTSLCSVRGGMTRVPRLV